MMQIISTFNDTKIELAAWGVVVGDPVVVGDAVDVLGDCVVCEIKMFKI